MSESEIQHGPRIRRGAAITPQILVSMASSLGLAAYDTPALVNQDTSELCDVPGILQCVLVPGRRQMLALAGSRSGTTAVGDKDFPRFHEGLFSSPKGSSSNFVDVEAKSSGKKGTSGLAGGNKVSKASLKQDDLIEGRSSRRIQDEHPGECRFV
jgi:hypothetical protein